MFLAKQKNVLPGFNLSLGYTLLYLSLIVLIPLSAAFIKTTELSFNEFWAVVKGNGPCNQQRLEHHIRAHKEGAWVRETAIASAKKHNI